MRPEDIGKFYDAGLNVWYGVVGKNIDIVELAAVYIIMLKTFNNDPDKKKQQIVLHMEATLQQLMIQQQNTNIKQTVVRNAAYDKQVPMFRDKFEFYEKRNYFE